MMQVVNYHGSIFVVHSVAIYDWLETNLSIWIVPNTWTDEDWL